MPLAGRKEKTEKIRHQAMLLLWTDLKVVELVNGGIERGIEEGAKLSD